MQYYFRFCLKTIMYLIFQAQCLSVCVTKLQSRLHRCCAVCGYDIYCHMKCNRKLGVFIELELVRSAMHYVKTTNWKPTHTHTLRTTIIRLQHELCALDCKACPWFQCTLVNHSQWLSIWSECNGKIVPNDELSNIILLWLHRVYNFFLHFYFSVTFTFFAII